MERRTTIGWHSPDTTASGLVEARPAENASMRYRVLGSLELDSDGRPLELRGARQRALLAIFLLHPNEVLSPDRLLEDLWDGAPPAGGRNPLQMQISRLRKVVDAQVLETRENGYVLNVEQAHVDVYEFERQLENGIELARAGDFAAATDCLGCALALWRGRPFEDLFYKRCAQTEIERLVAQRLLALEERIEAELALGRGPELVAELERLVCSHPFRERFRAQLMLALYRAGRQGEALQAFQDARCLLREELGLEPGPLLKDRQRAILKQAPELVAGACLPSSRGSTEYLSHPSMQGARRRAWSCWQAGPS